MVRQYLSSSLHNWSSELRDKQEMYVMTNLVNRFVRCESGATAIEYGLIASLIGVAIIAATQALGNQLNSTFNKVTDGIAKK